jgi:hypothetical protein
MNRVILPLWISLTMFLGTLGGASAQPCVTVDFNHLVSNPAAYEGTCVSIIGVTDGDGLNFTLFRPPDRGPDRSILVFQKREPPRYRLRDGHWVKVSGVVAIDKTGLFACRLLLENLKALRRAPVPGVRTFGIFANEGPETVQIEMVNTIGDDISQMTLAPGDINKTEISEGKFRILTGSASSLPGKVLSISPLPTVDSASNYFEKSTRTFYFSLRNGKATLLKPRRATVMRDRWETIEQATGRDPAN